jgi:GR25 family glycosyltransferase involved in LPS biosynthesis
VYGVVGKEVVEDFLNRGQIGCFMSHYGIWKKILAQNQNYALVLEDDAIISLPEDFQSIQKTIDNLPSNWDICYLGGVYQDSKSAYNVNQNIVRSDTSVIWHAHAYLITKSAALNLVKQSREVLEKNRISDFDNIIPADDWMTHPDRRLNVYNTDPRIVEFIRDGVSDTSTNY